MRSVNKKNVINMDKQNLNIFFNAFYDLVDSGLDNIKINKNGSKSICNWTIQILDFKSEILEESKSWTEKFKEEIKND